MMQALYVSTEVVCNHELCTYRDKMMINNLRNGVLLHNDAWSQELDLMEEWGCKAELEALYNVYGFAGFCEMLAQRVIDNKYLP